MTPYDLKPEVLRANSQHKGKITLENNGQINMITTTLRHLLGIVTLDINLRETNRESKYIAVHIVKD